MKRGKRIFEGRMSLKKILFYILMVVFCCVSIISETSFKIKAEEPQTIDIEQENEYKRIGGYYKDSIGGEQYNEIIYSDAFVLKDANTLSGEMAKISVTLAMAAYNDKDGDKAEAPERLNNYLTAMGFTDITNYQYETGGEQNKTASLEDNDYVAYTIASKTIGDKYILYCVPVRGTSGNSEWYSNFNLGNGKMHEGFDKASQNVLEQLNAKIEQDAEKEENTERTRIVWFTGHSRGAAVANILAGKYTDGQYNSKGELLVEKEHVFGYTFACPAVSCGLTNKQLNYKNIYNYNNGGDLIAGMPLEDWGYQRYGTDIKLDLKDRENFKQRFLNDINKEYVAPLSSGAEINVLKQFIPSKKDYFSSEATTAFAMIGWGMGGKSDGQTIFDTLKYYKSDILEGRYKKYVTEDMSSLAFLNLVSKDIEDYEDVVDFIHGIDIDSMTNEEFLAYIEDHSEEFLKLTSFTGTTIVDKASYVTAANMVPTLAVPMDRYKKILSIVWMFVTSEFKPASAVAQGHTQATYVLWINSMYYGYKGWEKGTLNDFNWNNISTIGYRCFADCILPNAVLEIPGTIKLVSSYAFSYDYKQAKITELIINSGTELSYCSFYSCYSIKKISIPIDYSYKKNCYPFGKRPTYLFQTEIFYEVETIHYTKGTTGIMPDRTLDKDSDNYQGCSLEYFVRTTLKNVTYEEGITRIGANAYHCNISSFDYNNGVLENVKLPETLKSIGESAFENQHQLKEIIMPNSLENLGNACFRKCSKLEKVSYSSSLETIPNSCFAECNFKKIEFPSTIKNVGSSAFYSCNNIEEIILTDSDISIKSNAFGDCGEIKLTIPVDFDFKERCFASTYATTIYYTKGTTGIMPDISLKSDSVNYFGNRPEYISRNNLKSVEFEEGVIRIGDNAFRCRLQAFDYDNGVLENVKLPETLKSIGESAFENQYQLKEIIMPNSLEELGASCFEECRNLEKVSYSSSLETIPNSCFAECNFKKIEFPSTIKNVGSSAFYSCNNIEEIILTDSDISIKSNAFGDCGEIKLTIPVDFDFKERCFASTYATTIYYTKGTTGIMPDISLKSDSVNYFGNRPEYISRNNLKSVEFEEGVIRIGDNAFRCRLGAFDDENGKLESVKLPLSLQSIGSYAFECQDLEEIQIPKGLKMMGANAFFRCPNINIKCYKNSVTHEYVEKYEIPYTLLDNNVVLVQKILINVNDMNQFVVGKNYVLQAQVFPENATSKEVLWSSSNPSVATIGEATGKLTTMTTGTTIITVVANDEGKVTESIEIQVIPEENSSTEATPTDSTTDDGITSTVTTEENTSTSESIDNITTEEVTTETIVPEQNLKPTPVKNLKAVSVAKTKVKLTWTATEKDVKYLIYAKKKGKYGYCGMTSSTSYTDTKALSDEFGFYWVYPYKTDETGKNIVGSCTKYVYARGVCVAVTDLKASSIKGGVKLSWTKSAGAEGYLIYGMEAKGKYGYIGMTKTNTYTHKKASKNVYNFYWVFPYHRDAKGKIVVGKISSHYVYGKAK